jgi:hypothetical protein
MVAAVAVVETEMSTVVVAQSIQATELQVKDFQAAAVSDSTPAAITAIGVARAAALAE